MFNVGPIVGIGMDARKYKVTDDPGEYSGGVLSQSRSSKAGGDGPRSSAHGKTRLGRDLAARPGGGQRDPVQGPGNFLPAEKRAGLEGPGHEDNKAQLFGGGARLEPKGI